MYGRQWINVKFKVNGFITNKFHKQYVGDYFSVFRRFLRVMLRG